MKARPRAYPLAMRKPTRLFLIALLVATLGGCERSAQAEATEITVYKSPTCGCCNGWIDHLKAAGFSVTAHNREDMAEIKSERGVPKALGSCHTAEVAGYVIEGHVPPADIQRLLETKPNVAGLAVPGMPIGSPGMEGPNPEAYEVLEFKKNGESAVFATHGPNP